MFTALEAGMSVVFICLIASPMDVEKLSNCWCANWVFFAKVFNAFRNSRLAHAPRFGATFSMIVDGLFGKHKKDLSNPIKRHLSHK